MHESEDLPMRRALMLALGIAVLWTPAAEAKPLTGNDLLARLTNPVSAMAPLPRGARVVQRSSHEREGGNRDWGFWSEGPERAPTYIRREEGGFVLLDEHRPGCLARMWLTAGPVLGNVGQVGRIQIFLDGARTPAIDVAPADFFAGRVPGFPQPLVGDADTSSGGFSSYVPICFARGIKLRVTSIPPDGNLWYQLTTLLLPDGTPVRSYRPDSLDTGGAAARLSAAGVEPSGERVSGSALLQPGQSLPLLRRQGAGSIRYLRIAVTPFLPPNLDGVELRVRVDGARAPQIEVPLGALFGDGLEVRPIRSIAFGMDPVAGSGYFALPISYGRGVEAEIVARTPAQVSATATLGRPLDDRAGVLFGRRTVEPTRRGLDFTVLRAGGSGRLVSWVLDEIGSPQSGTGILQYFLEGDERVHVDGSLSPSIYGTGTEDAFDGGFYYIRGPFSRPTNGAGIFLTQPDLRPSRSQYRVFGGDGYLWERGIRFGMEHGGGDEFAGGTAMSTAFWYGGPQTLRRTDRLAPGWRASARRHRLRGRRGQRVLTAYFEGEHDGDTADPDSPTFGGQAYPAPPPARSPEGRTATGVAFRRPIRFTLRVARRNCGVVLRRLLDAGEASAVMVKVGRKRVGRWDITDVNPAKRWRMDDFPLSSSRTAGHRRLRITLGPLPGTRATAFSIEALSRSCAR